MKLQELNKMLIGECKVCKGDVVLSKLQSGLFESMSVFQCKECGLLYGNIQSLNLKNKEECEKFVLENKETIREDVDIIRRINTFGNFGDM